MAQGRFWGSGVRLRELGGCGVGLTIATDSAFPSHAPPESSYLSEVRGDSRRTRGGDGGLPHSLMDVHAVRGRNTMREEVLQKKSINESHDK